MKSSMLDATLEYGLKAYNVYSQALRRWFERNPKSFPREKVQKLIVNYPDSRLSRPDSPARSGVYTLSSRTLEERQHMAKLKQQVNVDKKMLLNLVTHLRGDLRLRGQEREMSNCLKHLGAPLSVVDKRLHLRILGTRFRK